MPHMNFLILRVPLNVRGTLNHGDVRIVQIIGGIRASVIVPLGKEDVVSKSANEKMKDNIAGLINSGEGNNNENTI